MPLVTLEPPPASIQGLQEGLRRLSAHRGTAALFAPAGGAPASVGTAHKVFSIGLDALAQPDPLDSAQETGWRYLLTSAPGLGGGAVGAVDVNKVGDQHRFAQMHAGWLSEETRKAINIAQANPDVLGGNYEPRALRVPALLVDALWLKDTQGTNDLVVPIRSAAPKMNVGTVYKAADFIDDLRDIAAGKPKFNDRPLR